MAPIFGNLSLQLVAPIVYQPQVDELRGIRAVAGFFYLLLGTTALATGTSALFMIPDPALRATLAPATLTMLMVMAGTLLLLRHERLLAGTGRTDEPAGEPEPARASRHAFERTPDIMPPRLRTVEPDLPPVVSDTPLATTEPEPRPDPSSASRPERQERPGFFSRWRRKDPPPPEIAVPAAPAEPDLELSFADLLRAHGPEEAAPAAAAVLAEPERSDDPPGVATGEPEPAASSLPGAFSLFRRSDPEREAPATRVPSPPLRSAGPARLDLLLSDDDEPAGVLELSPAAISLFAQAPKRAEPLEGGGRAAVAQAIQEDALTVVRVPVVSLPQRRRRMVTVHLECRHGSTARDARGLLDGEAGELLAALDLEHVRAAVRAADRPVAGAENLPVIVRVAAASFEGEEARTALATLLNRRAAQSAALHLVLDAWPAGRSGAELVAILRRAGVGVGLDLNERPCLSPDAVAARRIGMVCLQAGELHQAALRAADGDLMEDIRTMQRQGVEVVVSGIGSERTLAEVLDFPIHLGTGELFGRIG